MIESSSSSHEATDLSGSQSTLQNADSALPSCHCGDYPLRGYHHVQPLRFLDQLHLGQPLTLLPEPENPYDAHAVRVLLPQNSASLPLGYLPREDNALYHQLLRRAVPLHARIKSFHPQPSSWQPLTLALYLGLLQDDSLFHLLLSLKKNRPDYADRPTRFSKLEYPL